jgi:molybdate transport system ATP-binding protein
MAEDLIADIEVSYSGGVSVRAHLRWDCAAAPVLALLGPSGSGKTTLLRAVAGLVEPAAGRIAFRGRIWFEPGRSLRPQQRRVGMLFQDYALFPHRTAAENIAYGLRRTPRIERDARTTELLELFSLGHLAARRPSELSGGERQRVALARTLAPRPALLLLDEPLSALDAPSRERLRDELRRRLLAAATPAVVVTHDRNEALALGDLVGVMADGKLHQVGPIEEVFQRPANEAVAHAVGVDAVLPATVLDVAAGLARFRTGSSEITGLALDAALGDAGFVCIRGEEVVLSPDPPGQDSARNHLAARVTGLRVEGPLVRVALDCGFPLAAWITRRSREEMQLEPGAQVWALVKAPSVHFVRSAR